MWKFFQFIADPSEILLSLRSLSRTGKDKLYSTYTKEYMFEGFRLMEIVDCLTEIMFKRKDGTSLSCVQGYNEIKAMQFVARYLFVDQLML